MRYIINVWLLHYKNLNITSWYFTGLSLTLMSYGDSVKLGVMSDTQISPQHSVISHSFDKQISQLATLAGVYRRPSRVSVTSTSSTSSSTWASFCASQSRIKRSFETTVPATSFFWLYRLNSPILRAGYYVAFKEILSTSTNTSCNWQVLQALRHIQRFLTCHSSSFMRRSEHVR